MKIMTRKTDQKIEEIEKWQRKREIEEGIRKGITHRMLAICMTATSAMMTIFYWAGSLVYQKSAALSAAMKAYLLMDKGGQ